MGRREFLKILGAGAVAGTASLSGCSGLFRGSSGKEDDQWEAPTETPEPEAAQGTFRYFFDDETGTLGNVGDDVPGDAEDFQIVENALEENEWQEFQTNDMTGEPEGAASFLRREHNESLEPVQQATQQYFENPREAFEDEWWNERYQDGDIWNADDAVVYTAALTKAVETETSIASSGGKGLVVNGIAEPFLDQLDIDIPGYSLSHHIGSEALDPDKNNWNIERDVAPDDVEGQRIKEHGGLTHALGLLQYRNEEENQEVKYVETTGPTGLWHSWLRDPENSHYAMPIDSEPRTNHNGVKRHPEHFVTTFEYDKVRQLAEIAGQSSNGFVDNRMMSSLYRVVDDATDDQAPSHEDVKSYGDTPGWDIVVEDSFGRSVQDFIYDPTPEKAEQFEYNARAFKQVMDHQGWDEPLRVGGTLEDPTYEHLARDEFEQIMEQRGN